MIEFKDGYSVETEFVLLHIKSIEEEIKDIKRYLINLEENISLGGGNFLANNMLRACLFIHNSFDDLAESSCLIRKSFMPDKFITEKITVEDKETLNSMIEIYCE